MTIEGKSNDGDARHDLWENSGKLLVIETPFREGRHFAKTPVDFLPIIDELEALHKQGFVHGDIRGFNTVFSSVPNKGWLIDFDFGGFKHLETTVYPEGYKANLNDGSRMGSGGKKITEWHDFYALAQLLFLFHDFVEPAGSTDATNSSLQLKHFLAREKWENTKEELLIENEMANMITSLKELLVDLNEAGWTFSPSIKFQEDLDKCDIGGKAKNGS